MSVLQFSSFFLLLESELKHFELWRSTYLLLPLASPNVVPKPPARWFAVQSSFLCGDGEETCMVVCSSLNRRRFYLKKNIKVFNLGNLLYYETAILCESKLFLHLPSSRFHLCCVLGKEESGKHKNRGCREQQGAKPSCRATRRPASSSSSSSSVALSFSGHTHTPMDLS